MAGLPPLIGYPVQIPMGGNSNENFPPFSTGNIMTWSFVSDFLPRWKWILCTYKVMYIYSRTLGMYGVHSYAVMYRWCSKEPPGDFFSTASCDPPAHWLFMIQVSAIFRLWEFTSIDVDGERRGGWPGTLWSMVGHPGPRTWKNQGTHADTIATQIGMPAHLKVIGPSHLPCNTTATPRFVSHMHDVLCIMQF